jgi:hypothetical protein
VSTTFPRTVYPRSATWPKAPTGLSSFGQSGKGQFRSTMQVGRVWTETWENLYAGAAATRTFLAQLELYYGQQTILDLYHPSQKTMVGIGTGTPLIKGASQTGASITTDGWTINITGILKAGDVLKIAGVNLVYVVTADCNSDGSGNATVSITPPIPTGGSPADNAALTTNATPASVLYRAMILDLSIPEAGPDEWYSGMTITFRELP